MNITKTILLLATIVYCSALFSQDTTYYYYPSGKVSSKGILVNKLFNGEWKNFYENDSLKSYGNFIDGKLNGFWYFFDDQGVVQKKISYQNGLKEGISLKYDSVEQIKESATYISDTLHGEFIRFNSQEKIITLYQKGKKQGVEKIFDIKDGRLTSTLNYNNDSLISSYNQNLYNSKGEKAGVWRTYSESGKLLSEKIYENGLLIAEKKIDKYGLILNENLIFDEITTYHQNGKLKTTVNSLNELKNGYEKHYSVLGELELGSLFKNDTLIGRGYLNNFGEFQGEWQFYYGNKNILSKGKYENGQKVGKWIYYFTDGKTEQTGNYIEGIPHGEWIWYYNNGTIRRIENLYKGKWQGQIQDFDSLGNELVRVEYYDDHKEGLYVDKIGDYEKSGAYKLNLKDGKWVEYYDNGKLAYKGSFELNVPVGKHKEYYYNGNKRMICIFSSGLLDGKKIEFFKDGKVRHRYVYKKGILKSVDGEGVGSL